MSSNFLKIIFALLICGTANAADFVTATVTITNAPTTNGMTFTVNGSTRTWTNAAATPTTQILTNDSIGGILTNLFTHIAANGFGAAVGINTNGTNSLKLYGTAVTVSFTGDYASVQYTTNTIGSGQLLRLPFTSQEQLTNRTNNANWLIDGLNDYGTEAFDSTAPALVNHVNLTESQTISGDKTFSGATIISNANARFDGGFITNATAGFTNGTIDNVTITGGTNSGSTIVGAFSISGNVEFLTNGLWVGASLSNGVNYGTAFSSRGTNTSSEQFGENAAATGHSSMAVGKNSTASGTSSLAVGNTAIASGESALAIGLLSFASGLNAMAVGGDAEATAENSTALGQGSSAGHINSTAVGYGSETTSSNQVMLGTASVSVKVNNQLEVGGYIVNPSHARTNNTSLANGNNAAVSIADRGYVKLSGPSGAFTINGIAGGSDGRIVTLQNSTGYTLTIANDSGTDPTATNRIYTGTSADISITNNPGFVELIYDSATSRWGVKSHSN